MTYVITHSLCNRCALLYGCMLQTCRVDLTGLRDACTRRYVWMADGNSLHHLLFDVYSWVPEIHYPCEVRANEQQRICTARRALFFIHPYRQFTPRLYKYLTCAQMITRIRHIDNSQSNRKMLSLSWDMSVSHTNSINTTDFHLGYMLMMLQSLSISGKTT